MGIKKTLGFYEYSLEKRENSSGNPVAQPDVHQGRRGTTDYTYLAAKLPAIETDEEWISVGSQETSRPEKMVGVHMNCPLTFCQHLSQPRQRAVLWKNTTSARFLSTFFALLHLRHPRSSVVSLSSFSGLSGIPPERVLLPVAPVLDRLQDRIFADRFLVFQVGDGAGDFEH
jgi:hypothetical protein